MPTVKIEHPVVSFDTWKRAFDADPVGREAAGVRRYQVYRQIDDPAFVGIDLEFEDRDRAMAFKANIERLWQSPQALALLGGSPRARVVDVVDQHSY